MKHLLEMLEKYGDDEDEDGLEATLEEYAEDDDVYVK